MARPKVFDTCKIEGCSNTANRKGANLCEMHYARMRRNGSHELMPLKDTYVHSNGYLIDRADHHALSMDGRTVYQHRKVYYDAHGAGPFQCHWCNKDIDWSFMHIDHVDTDKRNNDVSNLVASCPICNTSRGTEKMKDTFRNRVGVAFNGQIKTLNEWAKTIGISGVSLRYRLKEGWTLERALTTPRGKFGPKTKLLSCHNIKTISENKMRHNGA
jgi:hypothetical protein